MAGRGLVAATVVAAVAAAVVVGLRSHGGGRPPTARQSPFAPPVVAAPSPARPLTPRALSPAAASSRDDRPHHYEYVFPDGGVDVYDADRRWSLVERISLPDARDYHGVAASPRRHMLFLSVGGNGGSSGHGALIAFD